MHERRLQNIAKASTAVSKLDASIIGPRCTVHTLGVAEAESYLDVKSPRIIFTGNMGYRPNKEAVLWFYNEVWKPLNFKNVSFVIAGREPPKEVVEIQHKDPSVLVLGYVEDMQKEISQSLISVAPMQSGSGMQFKILEAMAAGTPVIATSLGKGSIKVVDKEHLLIANSGTEFCEKLKHLLSDEILRSNIQVSGRKFVHEYHNWEKLNKEFQKLLKGTLA